MDLLDFGLKPLSNYLSGTLREEVRRQAQRLTFEDGEALHRQGDDRARLCIVAAGTVRFGRFEYDGSFKLLSMLGPGAHYGDVALERRAFTQNVYAVGACTIDMIGEATLEALLHDHPGLAIALWRCNTMRLNAVLELYDDARTLSVAARLAKIIYLHAGRGTVPNGVACLQRELAELLGVTTVSIGKAVRALEQARLIESGYRRITVPDKARLKAWLRESGAV